MNFLSELSKSIVPYLTSVMGVWHTVLAYTIGAVSIIFLILSFQIKNRRKILIVNVIGSAGWTIYFALMGDLVSAFTGIIGIIRTIIFIFREKHAWARSPIWLVFFLAVSITLSILFFVSWKDIFPLLAGIFNIISFYMLKEKYLRTFSIMCYSFWMLNSISKMYVIALVSDVCTLTSVIVSLIRYNKLNKEKEQTESK